MNFVRLLREFSHTLGQAFLRGLAHASKNGLTEDLINIAVEQVKRAAITIVDNVDRREWVVEQLTKRGVPESIARLATEWAVQVVKAEASK